MPLGSTSGSLPLPEIVQAGSGKGRGWDDFNIISENKVRLNSRILVEAQEIAFLLAFFYFKACKARIYYVYLRSQFC